MIQDRFITISVAGSRRSVNWQPQAFLLSELYEKLCVPARSVETMNEYLALPKAKQDELKDVGGFVAGSLNGPRRKAGAVTGRDVITLDLDSIPPGGTKDVLRRVEGLGCGYCVYSTRKHSPAAPRLRVLLPLDRTATADEYEPIARKLAEIIGMELADPTTFQAHRLMYWPSCCADGEYIYTWQDKPMLSVDGLLALYEDWHDVAQWPRHAGEMSRTKLAARQGDPTAKNGVVGAFCRAYDIPAAMDVFLPGVYEAVNNVPGRYTYLGGSTTGGAVLYDEGKFLYSHHATDPCSGRLVNAFDLIRLHKFGELDDEATPGAPGNRLPSYNAMCELAVSDPAVASLMAQERYEAAAGAFSVTNEGELDWFKLLTRNTEGRALKTTKNVLVALLNDPLLQGRIKLDEFSDRVMGLAPMPWESRKESEGMFQWTDTDDAGLRDYIERLLGFRSREMVADAFLQCAAVNKYNPVKDYLLNLKWDGTPRLDTLYVDYFNAENCPYVRAVTRKAFVAAVARVMAPGVKFDTMTVVCGPQGTGKTTLFMMMGKQWSSNSLETFEGKDAAELLQGVWIIEIGELGAMDKSERNAVKSFMSKTFDQYRAPYARKAEAHPRRCVFFGTTNDHDYLRDTTGNRRFWPVDVGPGEPKKSVFGDLENEVDQLWAEAFKFWKDGESLILSPELEAQAEIRRASHMERDPLQGQIEEFIEQLVPDDWLKWNASRRSAFWAGGIAAASQIKLVARDRVCAAEIWRECLGDRRVMPKYETMRINRILENMPGWKRASTVRCGADYGTQKGFVRDYDAVNHGLKIVNHEGVFVNHPDSVSVNHVNRSFEDGLLNGLQDNAEMPG